MITLVMPTYLNSGMIAHQYQGWTQWPDTLKEHFEIILVDDGSPEPALDVPRPDGLPALRIYRVKEDQPWHQHAARNLGAREANEGWLLLTDMDHVLSMVAAAALVLKLPKLDAGTVYMLDRVEADTGKPTTNGNGHYKPHPNSFVMTREMFWRIGGYDEAYSGIYGTDALFRERCFKVAKRGHLNIPLTRYWRDLVPDASTTTLPRKEGRDPGAKDRVTRWKQHRGELDKISVMQFDWERVL